MGLLYMSENFYQYPVPPGPIMPNNISVPKTASYILEGPFLNPHGWLFGTIIRKSMP